VSATRAKGHERRADPGPETAARPPAPAPLRRGARSRSGRTRVRQVGVQLVLVLGGISIVAPLAYVFLQSFEGPGQYLTQPFGLLPSPWTLSEFRLLFQAVDVPVLMRNSVVITLLSALGATASCALVAYPLARIRFRGRNFVMLLVLATMMLPSQVLLIPQYVLFVKLGWVDTLLPLIVPSFFATSGFLVFFLRQAFRNVPTELGEAVLIDGGGHWTIFRRIIVPLSKSPLMIVFLLQAVASYNDFLAPSVYLHSPSVQTMPLGIEVASQTASGLTSEPAVMAGTLIFVLPLLALFLCLQRSLIRGIVLRGALR
jgi:multiple sugar transport system permease protein